MIKRAILEWQRLPYGSDKADTNTIPPESADKLAAVIKNSELAHALEHGRRELRARGVVGVIAAEGCSLEILPKIDGEETAIREKLVRMLSVALDMRIDVGAITGLQPQNETLLEVLIRAFATKLTDAAREGLPRRYVEHEDDLAVLRGALNITRQFTVLAANPARLACRYDNLSEDIALNQIMKATVARLRGAAQSNDNQRRLRELGLIYADVAEVSAAALPWDKVLFNRANHRWRELYNFARLIMNSRYQTTTTGDSRGFALLFEMSALFEEYIGRLMKRAFAGPGLQVSLQDGRRYCLTQENTRDKLFQTKPDIVIRRDDEVAYIIDTKWKRISSQENDWGVKQGDVYQMMAYAQVYDCDNLMLLYPRHAELGHDEGVHAVYRIAGGGKTLRVASFDVAAERGYAEIYKRLRALIAVE